MKYYIITFGCHPALILQNNIVAVRFAQYGMWLFSTRGLQEFFKFPK